MAFAMAAPHLSAAGRLITDLYQLTMLQADLDARKLVAALRERPEAADRVRTQA